MNRFSFISMPSKRFARETNLLSVYDVNHGDRFSFFKFKSVAHHATFDLIVYSLFIDLLDKKKITVIKDVCACYYKNCGSDGLLPGLFRLTFFRGEDEKNILISRELNVCNYWISFQKEEIYRDIRSIIYNHKIKITDFAVRSSIE